MRPLDTRWIETVVRAALAEDVGPGDITTRATVPETAQARGVIVAREALVVAGLEVAAAVFHGLDAAVRVQRETADGASLEPGAVLLGLAGPARALLTGERVALNFLQRLCGIATLTRAFVDAVAGTGAVLLDTRKTTPGLRALEKYAVGCGGGQNHRFGLHDAVLIKDNHLAVLRREGDNPVALAVARARSQAPGCPVEVEADTLSQVDAALAAGADIILLDNMSLEQLREAVRRVAGRAKCEASGGVTLASVRSIAETGVDFISVGALTHSARAMDLALDFELA